MNEVEALFAYRGGGIVDVVDVVAEMIWRNLAAFPVCVGNSTAVGIGCARWGRAVLNAASAEDARTFCSLLLWTQSIGPRARWC